MCVSSGGRFRKSLLITRQTENAKEEEEELQEQWTRWVFPLSCHHHIKAHRQTCDYVLNSTHLISTGPSHSVETDEEEEDEVDGRKRRRSDSYSLTFDESLSWCVIGGLGSGRDRHSSQSSDSHSSVSLTHTNTHTHTHTNTDWPLCYQSTIAVLFCNNNCVCVQSGTSEVTVAASSDSDSDNFSVEFEVESITSDDYNEDDASLSADDQVNTQFSPQRIILLLWKDSNRQSIS